MMNEEGIKYLDWDSEFFKVNIGRITAVELTGLIKALKTAKDRSYDCIYFETIFAKRGVMNYCLANDFNLVGIKMNLAVNLQSLDKSSYLEGISFIKKEEYYHQIEKIVLNSCAPLSRFAFDPRFGLKRTRRLYREWINKSFRGDFSETIIFSVEPDEIISGFTTLRKHSGKIFIDLFAVSEEFRGKEVSVKLFHSAKNWSRKNGYEQLFVLTQGYNIAALRSYQKNGFVTDSVNIIFHRWLK